MLAVCEGKLIVLDYAFLHAELLCIVGHWAKQSLPQTTLKPMLFSAAHELCYSAAGSGVDVIAIHEKDVRAIFIEHGCRFVQYGNGDHEIWYSLITGRHFTVDGKIKSRHTASVVMEQSGVPDHFA